MYSTLAFIVFLAVVVLAAASGAIFMPGAWYAGLLKPSWTPPNWLFAPAWSVLYIMIATAGWLIWQVDEEVSGRTAALIAWGGQLVFNGAWSWLMFGLHRIDWALADIALLWLAISAFVAVTWRSNRPAAWLFVPYLAWVSFAAALNFAVWRLNP